jgi:hypothetical protein
MSPKPGSKNHLRPASAGIARLFAIATGVFVFSAIFGRPSLAAEIGLFSTIDRATVGQEFAADLKLDTAGAAVNAVEGKLVLPPQVTVKEIRDGDSIVNFWIERPQAAAAAIAFSGITPGGYDGKDGLLFTVVFTAKEAGAGEISIVEAKALLNDGEGSAADLKLNPLRLNVLPGRALAPVAAIADTLPPEPFTPLIASSTEIFGGKNFLVFAAQDKGSGIAYYEIKEVGSVILGLITPWRRGESPYLLTDQGLGSKIYVKAVDKAGNALVAEVKAEKPLGWRKNPDLYIMIAIGIIVLGAVVLGGRKIGRRLWRRSAKSSS